MGSWYSTCFMSHLPLIPGDDIAIFLLAPNYKHEKDGLTCYPTDRYSPIGFPIFAEYDDDTQFRNIREINEYMERYLQEFATVYTRKRHCGDIGEEDTFTFEKYEWADLEHFVEGVVYGKLWVDDRNGEKQRLEHTMVHTDLYNKLIQNISQRIPYGQTETLETLTYRKILKTMEWLKEEDELIAKLKHEMPLMEFWPLKKFTDKVPLDTFSRWDTLNTMARYFIETDDGYILDHILNYILWNQVMNYSRYGYHCVSGGGSQCQEMMLQKIIAEFVVVKCTERELGAEEDGYNGSDGSVLEETLLWWDD